MKKIIWCLLVCCVFTACSEGENAKQIESFWDTQKALIMTKLFGIGSPLMSRGAVQPEQLSEQDMQNFEEMVKDWEQTQPEPEEVKLEAPAQPEPPEQPQPPVATEVKPKPAPKKRPKRQESQFMDITMEDPSGAVEGKAPLKDRQAMQKSLEKVMQDNENMLHDIVQAFGTETQAQAFEITAKTEKALRRQAASSASLQEYLKVERQLLKKQEQSLNQLMQNNARRLR